MRKNASWYASKDFLTKGISNNIEEINMSNLEKIEKRWLFPESVSEAHASQKEMAEKVVLEDSFSKPPKIILGMDVSNNLYDPTHLVFASAVLMSYPELTIIESVSHTETQKFPYIPGLLGFREAPALIHAFQKLQSRPDIIMVDGHGVSHPRGLGIASHLGVLLDIPTIGVAKNILVGAPDDTLSEEEGSQVPVIWKGDTIAMMLRSKKRSNPIIVSSGHKISLGEAVSLVTSCLKGYKLPEPTRQAHIAANISRRSHMAK